MEKEPRILKLPNAAQGGALVSILVDNIISMEVPTDSTIIDETTGEVYNIDIEKHTLVYVKSYKQSGNYEFYIPLTLKEMILLVNSDAAYHS